MSNASLLLTFWLHLKPDDRNMSLLLRSQLGELLSASVGAEKLQLVSLLVEGGCSGLVAGPCHAEPDVTWHLFPIRCE